jgi:hypothetical protein
MDIITKLKFCIIFDGLFNYIPEGDVVIRLTFFPNTHPACARAFCIFFVKIFELFLNNFGGLIKQFWGID